MTTECLSSPLWVWLNNAGNRATGKAILRSHLRPYVALLPCRSVVTRASTVPETSASDGASTAVVGPHPPWMGVGV